MNIIIIEEELSGNMNEIVNKMYDPFTKGISMFNSIGILYIEIPLRIQLYINLSSVLKP